MLDRHATGFDHHKRWGSNMQIYLHHLILSAYVFSAGSETQITYPWKKLSKFYYILATLTMLIMEPQILICHPYQILPGLYSL
jgi:hypothetical protein